MNSTGSNPNLGYQFSDADGVPLSLGYVVTKLAGLSTLASTYADVTLSTPNANSVTLASTLRLDAAGRAVMYFSPVNGGVAGVAYDVYIYDSSQVLTLTIEDVTVPAPAAGANLTGVVIGYGAAQSRTIAGGAFTPSINTVHLSPESGAADNLDNIAITDLPDGAPLTLSNTSGSAAITIRHGIGNIRTPDGQNIVLSTTDQRQTFTRDGSNWFLIGSSTAPVLGNGMVNGRLTVTSGSPISPNSSSGATIYFTPFLGNAIDLYNGSTNWNRLTFSQISIAVPSALSKVYDVFAYNNSGVVALELSTAWTDNVTRSQALTTQDGVYVKSGATTRRYLGSICTLDSSSTLVYDDPARRCLWNYYNRIERSILVTDTGSATSSYNTATYRQANANVANQAAILIGIPEDAISLKVTGLVAFGTAGDRAFVALSTTATAPYTPLTGSIGQSSGSTPAGGYSLVQSSYIAPVIGLGLYVWCERGVANGTTTWQYSGVDATLINTGISGTVRG